MRRREFTTGLASAAAWPLMARAQQPVMPVVGFVAAGSRARRVFDYFGKGLAEAGYVEGRNFVLAARWAEGQYERLPSLVTELIERRASVIIAAPAPAAIAAMKVTTTTPIVFTSGFDPVRIGLVASYNRPGGNVTGVTYFTNELSEKRFDLLRQVAPDAKTIAVVVNPDNPAAQSDATDMIALKTAAHAIGRSLVVFEASTENDLSIAFKLLVQQGAEATMVAADPFFIVQAPKSLHWHPDPRCQRCTSRADIRRMAA